MKAKMMDDLKNLDLETLKPLAGFGLDPAKLANASLRLQSGRTLRARYRRSFQVIDRAAKATAQLERLPEPGESVHCVLKGNFPLAAFVPAVIDLTGGEPIERLTIATLGFSKRNVDDFAALIADGLLKDLAIVCSHYFSAVDAPIMAHFTATLPQCPCVPLRTHAKVLAIETAGQFLTVESSANLRSKLQRRTSSHHERPGALRISPAVDERTDFQRTAAERGKARSSQCLNSLHSPISSPAARRSSSAPTILNSSKA
jgi:hypothetical protein